MCAWKDASLSDHLQLFCYTISQMVGNSSYWQVTLKEGWGKLEELLISPSTSALTLPTQMLIKCQKGKLLSRWLTTGKVAVCI